MGLQAVALLVSAAVCVADSTPLTIINDYDDDYFRFSFGAPGHCVGESPECGHVDSIKKGV